MSYASITKRYKSKQQKTFSQNIAIFLAILNFPSVVLSAIALILLLIIGVFYIGYFISLPLFLVILFMCILKLVMFVGYVKHAHGNLSRQKIRRLWLYTIFYNLSLLVTARWIILREWFETNFWDVEFWQQDNTILCVYWLLWLVTSCSLAFLSLYSDKLDYRKTRNSGNVP